MSKPINIFNKKSMQWTNPTEAINEGVVKFGQKNDFPQYLGKLYNESSLHAACINAKHEAMIGKGLEASIEGILGKANKRESWNKVYNKVALDYLVFGYFAMEISWRDNGTIDSIHHIDASLVRACQKNAYGRIDTYALSSEWDKSGSEYIMLPAYNPETWETERKQLLVFQPYRPTLEYYTLPTYAGAIRTIDLDTQVDNFHTNNIRNGLAPSLSITTFTGASDEDKRFIERALRDQYAGSENAGSFIYMDVDDPVNAPVITPINQNASDGYYSTINGIIEQKILSAHLITNPMLLGIKTSGQLGGREEAIDSYLLFQNTVIRPLQQDVLDIMQELLQVNYGEEAKLSVIITKLFDDGEEEEEVVVATEEGEDTETEIEENL